MPDCSDAGGELCFTNGFNPSVDGFGFANWSGSGSNRRRPDYEVASLSPLPFNISLTVASDARADVDCAAPAALQLTQWLRDSANRT